MKFVDYHGYTIYEDGTIIGLYGKEVKKRNNNGRYEVRIMIDSKRCNFTVARLIYHAFYPFDLSDKNICISFKDNDKLNVHLNNLYQTERKDLIQGEKHISRSKLTNQQAEEIKSLYKGKTGSNQYDKVGYSLQDLANKYGVSKSNIMWIVKGMSREEKDYKLK